MNPSGLWRGMTEDGRIGHFKFINVEMIPQRSNERKRSDRRKRSNASQKGHSSCNQQQPTTPETHKTSVCSNEEHNSDLTLSRLRSSSSPSMFKRGKDEIPGLRNDFAVKKPNEEDQSNPNSRPKSVEDLLRRIGLEVSIHSFSGLFFFKLV